MTFREAQLLREAYAEKRKVQDWPLALLFWQTANINRDSEAHPEPFDIVDVMQMMGHQMEPPAPPTVEEMANKLAVLTEIYGGEDVRRNGQRTPEGSQ